MTASLNPSTTQLLDVFIAKQEQLKRSRSDRQRTSQADSDSYRARASLEALDDAGRFNYKNLTIQVVPRKTWKYSSAVETLKEREQFNGHATQSTSASYRFIVKDTDS